MKITASQQAFRRVTLFTAVLGIIFSCRVLPALAGDSSTLYIQPGVGYSMPRFFQESQASSYRGLTYGASLYYKFSAFGKKLT